MVNNKIYIIAEAGVNHNGSLVMAKQLIDVAVAAGANAVKFQTFKAAVLVSADAPKAAYQMSLTEQKETQYAMLKRLELSETAHIELARYCQQKNIDFLSTPFDGESLDLLIKNFDLPFIKIPSGEITNAPFLLQVAQCSKPVILSTGMSTLGEVENALKILAFGYMKLNLLPQKEIIEKAYISQEGQDMLRQKVTLLHCTTEYPAPFAEVNLKAMDTLKAAFGLPVGYSDHTDGIAISLAAAARGAVIIEKHFTLDKKLPGPDHQASIDPDELKCMVTSVRQIECALGSGHKAPAYSELKNRTVIRKSLVALAHIKKNDCFTTDNLGVKRPGEGISPMYFWDLLGTKAEKDYEFDEKI